MRGILGSGRTRGVSFQPFLNSFGWWWLISSIFLVRICCHKTTHANGYYGAWPGWAVSISVLPLTVILRSGMAGSHTYLTFFKKMLSCFPSWLWTGRCQRSRAQGTVTGRQGDSGNVSSLKFLTLIRWVYPEGCKTGGKRTLFEVSLICLPFQLSFQLEIGVLGVYAFPSPVPSLSFPRSRP